VVTFKSGKSSKIKFKGHGVGWRTGLDYQYSGSFAHRAKLRKSVMFENQTKKQDTSLAHTDFANLSPVF
jgi:hypothetical protein